MLSSLHTTHWLSPRRLYNLMHLSAFAFGVYAFGFPKDAIALEIALLLMGLTGLAIAFAATAYAPLRATPHSYRIPLALAAVPLLMYLLTEQLRPGPENSVFFHAGIGGAITVFIATMLFIMALFLMRERRRF